MDTYLHIKKGVKYPSILFTASMNDSRVAVWQPAKAVAKFQEVCTGDNLILFRIEDKGTLIIQLMKMYILSYSGN